jgi:hypothetical protein
MDFVFSCDCSWILIRVAVLICSDGGTSDPGSFTSTVSALDPSGTSSDAVLWVEFQLALGFISSDFLIDVVPISPYSHSSSQTTSSTLRRPLTTETP